MASEFVNKGSHCRVGRAPAKLVFNKVLAFHNKCVCCDSLIELLIKAVLKRAKISYIKSENYKM